MEIDSVQFRRVDVEEILDLRYEILRAGLPRDAAHFPGDNDAATVHLAAKDGAAIIACATVLMNQWQDRPACQLRGMAVATTWQSRGIGSRLLDQVHRVAREAGVALLWANARKPATAFYKKHGWEIASEEFEIPTAGPHFKMIRKLD